MRFDAPREAQGKWPGILNHFGITWEIGNPHSICPICGKKKWRMDDKEGRGSWICSCGAGDGFHLLQKIKGWSFKESCQELEKILSSGMALKCDLREKQEKPIGDIKKALNSVYNKSYPYKKGGQVDKYLVGRGLEIRSAVIRESLECWNSEKKTRMAAMICRFTGPDGKPLNIHRTYLENGKKAKVEDAKKYMTSTAPMDGGAIRLFPAETILGITEGIETALAATQLFGIPTWAAMDAGNLAKFEPPKNVEKLVIYGDNDASFTGQKAAYNLAWIMVKKGIKVEVRLPEIIGDWLDVLNQGRGKP